MTRCSLFFGVLAIAAVAGCHRDDATLTARVQANVNQKVQAPTANVEVQVDDGVVTLSGVVPTGVAKQRAVAAAKQIDGVKGVRDDLKVGGATSTPSPQNEQP